MSYDLKSESEVKEYLNNLGIEYRFGCYSEKNPDVCHLLGEFLESIKTDYEKAARVYRNNCDEYKYGKSCLKYGGYCLTGKGVNQSNYPAAYNYFKKGCDLDEPNCCFNQAILLVTQNEGFGVQQDVIQGQKLLEKACSANNDTACYYLSGLYIAGATNGNKIGEKGNNKNPQDIPRNMEKAFKYALKGCELGNMYSCANVSMMYSQGDGVEKNETLSAKYKERTRELEKRTDTSSKPLKFQVGIDK